MCSTFAFAQGELDAYRYSQSDILGTARSISMGGAFGALGGDISSMWTNPAGLGVYHSSEIVTTLSFNNIYANSNWNGTKVNGDKNLRVNFDNIAYVGYYPTGNDEGLISWNVGFAYNRMKNFYRNYRFNGHQSYSLADYAAVKANGEGESNFSPLLSSTTADDTYQQLGGLWMPALAYQGGAIGAYLQGGDIYHSAFGQWSKDGNTFNFWSPDDVNLNVHERGYIDKYDFSFATNISNTFFIGATLAVTDLYYKMNSKYDEYFGTGNDKDHLYLDNYKKTDGTGYSFNIGALIRPVDAFRFGVAYCSPTWYKLTDYYQGELGTSISLYDPSDMTGRTPDGVYTDYKLRSSDKWIFSAAAIIGTNALLSVDYELENFKNVKLSDRDDNDYADNDLISKDFGSSNTLKVGAEVKVTPQFSIRCGGSWRTSPLKDDFKNGKLEVYPSGTVPNYTLYKGTDTYSIGFGYRFTPHFYTDFACVTSQYKEDAYAFPSASSTVNNTKYSVVCEPVSLKTNLTQIALTFGYKF